MTLSSSRPHYLLWSSSDPVEKTWRFSICSAKGTPLVEVSDHEPDAQADRLALLPVVLGLEALEEPSHVTLCTSSRYVQEGIRFGLPEWQANGWQWEYFGQMVPVKNRDLWQRVERALRFHQVECRSWRFDPPHKPAWTQTGTIPRRSMVASSVCPPAMPPTGGNQLSGSDSMHSGVSYGSEKRQVLSPMAFFPQEALGVEKSSEDGREWGKDAPSLGRRNTVECLPGGPASAKGRSCHQAEKSSPPLSVSGGRKPSIFPHLTPWRSCGFQESFRGAACFQQVGGVPNRRDLQKAFSFTGWLRCVLHWAMHKVRWLPVFERFFNRRGPEESGDWQDRQK